MGSSSSAPIQADRSPPTPTDVGNTTAVLISSVIRKLRSGGNSKALEEIINELMMILNFLRDKKLGEESKLRYLIDDLIEMVLPLDIWKDKFDLLMIIPSKSWLGVIRKRMLEFGVDGGEMGSKSVEIEGDDDSVVAIGLEEDVELLLRAAIFNEPRRDQKYCLWTCLITGVAGIGKTTLARQVYNDADVIGRFDRRAWVCVSTGLTNKEILMKLIQQVVDSEELERGSLLEKLELADNESLQHMLRRLLQGMRYLIVLDDVPKEMTMHSILKGLPREDIGSRLLFTSRATHIQRIPYYFHEMEPLNFDKSWQLFLETIFHGNKSELPKELVKNGRDMLLTQCGGMPLAIKEMARQLAEKRRSGSEWEQLLQPTDSAAILEAITLPVIQKLDSRREREVKGVTDDLRMMVDFVRDKKLGEGSRLYCLICDAVDMARDLVKKRHISEIVVKPVRNWTREIKMCIIEFDGVDTESPVGLENFGEEDEDEDPVGLEDDVEMLVRRATITREHESTRLSTCLVTGMVGIGKTTLARQVYNHARIIDQFDVRVWVCVSTNFTHRKVLMKIIRDVIHCGELERDSLLEKMERLDNFFLREMLHNHLQGMRYFIVLDDFPKKMCLKYILEALPCEAMRIEKLQQILATAGFFSEYETESCMSVLTEECIVEIKDKKSCRVNAILHMLSVKKAKEETGLEILRKSGSSRPSRVARHRVIICSRDKFSYSTDQDGRLVSLFVHGGGNLDTSLIQWKGFELLKILDFEDFGLKRLPETIGTSLTRLRYMGLRNNHIHELPHSLGCMEELEVFDIALNFMVEVPDIIWKLGNLRHLFMSDVICGKPLKIDMLENLKTLTYISVDNWTYGPLRLTKMYSLHKLGIEEVDENSDLSKLFASLAFLHKLGWLILRGYRFRSMPCLDKIGIIKNLKILKLEGLLARLPNAGNFPPNIDYLNLVNSRLDEDPMIVLEKLPRLRRLKLRNAYIGQQMVILHGGFLMLEVLSLEELWNLRNLQVGEGAIKRLVKLEIKSCPYMETLPKEIGSMKELEELKIVTTRSIATKIRKSALVAKIRVVDINPS